jgi:hypothetical protein
MQRQLTSQEKKIIKLAINAMLAVKAAGLGCKLHSDAIADMQQTAKNGAVCGSALSSATHRTS